jgi:hypothetical protein
MSWAGERSLYLGVEDLYSEVYGNATRAKILVRAFLRHRSVSMQWEGCGGEASHSNGSCYANV